MVDQAKAGKPAKATIDKKNPGKTETDAKKAARKEIERLRRELAKLQAADLGAPGKEGEAARKEEKDRLRQALAKLKAVDSNHKVGLALSGGGYRASLFHVGALWRLNELGWLPKLDYITSVSGGSIVAAFLGMRWSDLGFDKVEVDGVETHHGVARNFESEFVKPMREMFRTTIDVESIGRGLLNPWGEIRGRMDGKSIADGTVGLLGELAEYVGGGMGKSIATGLARPFAPFVATGVDAATAAWDMNPFPTPPELLIKAYDRILFEGKTLQNLPDWTKDGNPQFILYATNMQTGVSVRMSRRRVYDYKLGEVKKPDVPLARAVAASSGFPPFYCPVELRIPHERWSRIKKERPNRMREKIDLADGAVYDNMGLEALIQKKCDTILVSDAGDSLDILEDLPFEWLSQAVRTLNIAMSQVNNLRYRKLSEEFEQEERKGVYWGISKRLLEKDPWIDPKHPLPARGRGAPLLKDSERIRELGEMRTRLNEFTDEEQENLINWGYALADARMRQYVIEPEDVLYPGKLPFPDRLV